jgi:hypothetical protein
MRQTDFQVRAMRVRDAHMMFPSGWEFGVATSKYGQPLQDSWRQNI